MDRKANAKGNQLEPITGGVEYRKQMEINQLIIYNTKAMRGIEVNPN